MTLIPRANTETPGQGNTLNARGFQELSVNIRQGLHGEPQGHSSKPRLLLLTQFTDFRLLRGDTLHEGTIRAIHKQCTNKNKALQASVSFVNSIGFFKVFPLTINEAHERVFLESPMRVWGKSARNWVTGERDCTQCDHIQKSVQMKANLAAYVAADL